ncbi:hypothetical protein DLJ48_08630 [Oenococcus sicerae]|uniref:Uncharacterized protein n=1 Tax=Oenococcus sicerae TaxID=2203724 RepID=A0ABX6J5E2_9LACO|nr:hypothetical protein [Oenococcus sicerae]QHW12503.1 hypothetical protein DLJ48_08630 [Oenococcus sicerae]
MSLKWQARALQKLAESKEENLVRTGIEPIVVSFTIVFSLLFERQITVSSI